MKTAPYLRVSISGQDVATQKLVILDYARRHRFRVAKLVEAQLSSRPARQREEILQTIDELPAGDRLVVSELSRLGRGLGQIIQAVDQLLKKGVSLIAIKESIRLESQQDLQTKVSKASIAKILDAAPTTLHSFVQLPRLEHQRRRRASRVVLQL